MRQRVVFNKGAKVRGQTQPAIFDISDDLSELRARALTKPTKAFYLLRTVAVGLRDDVRL